MKITRKEGVKKIRIEHNKTLFWIIIILIILLIAVIYFIVNNKKTEIVAGGECSVDSDCAEVCDCHPEKCIPVKQKAECPSVFCTQVCSGPLDCGAGSCGCIKGKCQVVPSE